MVYILLEPILISFVVPDPDIVITTSPDYSYYYYREDITLSCILSYPTNIQYYIDVPTQAMIQWIKDGRVIDNEPIASDIYTSNITLSNVNASNAGVYDCKAVIGNNYHDEYIHVVSSSIVVTSIDISVISE